MKPTILLAIAALMLIPGSAAAQNAMPRVFVSPFVGPTAGGGSAAVNGAPTVGVSAGWHSKSWWTVEAELADTQDFFDQDDFRTNRRVTTLMGNLIVGRPVGSRGALNAYGVGGFGMVRPHLSEAGNLAEVDVKQAGFSVGGGIVWMAKNGIGLRGDARYIRSFGDEANDSNPFGLTVSSLDFVRVSGGLVVGF
jgi:hypothetical protein